MKAKHWIIVLIAFALGFFLRGLTLERKGKERYEQGKEVTGEVYTGGFKLGVDYTELKPKPLNLPAMFWRTDTIIRDNNIVETRYIDSAKVVEDFILRRDYSFNVFDNENGKLDVNQSIQFNRLQAFDYSFTPMQKVVNRERLFVPFVSASYSTFNVVGVGGGVFIRNVGVEYQYQNNYLTGVSGHGIGMKVRF